MKKYVLVFAMSYLLIGSSSASVGTGFYLGAHTGYMNSSAKLEALHGTATAHVGRHRPHVGAFLGYGWVQNAIYTGFELGYGFEPNSFETKVGPAKISFKRPHNFLGALRLGALLNSTTMIYGRIGGNFAKYEVATKNIGKISNKKRLSPVVGVGIDTALSSFNRNMVLRTEWTYDFGRSLKGSNVELKKLHTQKFTLGVAYRF